METSLENGLSAAHAEAAAVDVPEPPYVAFMDRHFEGLAYTIVDGALTAGNCHGLTFGAGGATMIQFTTVPRLLAQLGWDADGDWVEDESADILACFIGVQVAHTATKSGAVWRQTLPGGPIFTSTLAALQTKYDCFDLSTRAGRAGVLGKHDEVDALRKELIALCDEGTQDEELNEYYLPRWREQAVAGELGVPEMNNYIGQIRDAQ